MKETKGVTSVDLAYELAINSYSEARKSWDAMHDRINKLLAILLPLIAAVPIALKALNIDNVGRSWFIATGVLVIVALVFCLVACSRGVLARINPSVLFESYLDFSPCEFKKAIIEVSGCHMEDNVKAIGCKWKLFVVAIISFGLAVFCLFALVFVHVY